MIGMGSMKIHGARKKEHFLNTHSTKGIFDIFYKKVFIEWCVRLMHRDAVNGLNGIPKNWCIFTECA